jgi:hypothetical protein
MRYLLWFTVALGVAAAAAAAPPVKPAAAGPTPGGYVVAVEINAGACERLDGLVDVVLDAKVLGVGSGVPVPPSADSLDIVEVKPAGGVIDPAVPFQYDRIGEGLGTLVVQLKGTTPAGATRHYRLTFRQAGKTFLPRKVPAMVELADDFEYAELNCFRVFTPPGIWYYDKAGAGFAALHDTDGNDWVGYSSAAGSAGNSRGIPHLVPGKGLFRPGGKDCTSKALAGGPLKVTVESQSKDGKWACRWDITAAWARLTVLKADGAYWLAYHGTPGGKFDQAATSVVRSGGKRTPAGESWAAALEAPKWVYFARQGGKRSLFLASHQDDKLIDSYEPVDKCMASFAFGRKGAEGLLKQVPAQFTIGLCSETDPAKIAATILSACQPYQVKLTPVGRK